MAHIPILERLPRPPWFRDWPLLLPSIGRRLRWRIERDPVSFTLQSVSVVPGLPGRLRSARVTVTDVCWSNAQLERVRIHATNVRLRSAVVVADHVELQIELGQDGLDALLESGLPYAKLHLDGDGCGRAELLNRPHWGHVELAPAVEDGGLVLHPQAVVGSQGRRWYAPAKVLPKLRIGAEVLLPGASLRAATVADHRLHLTAEITDVEIPLRARPVDETSPVA